MANERITLLSRDEDVKLTHSSKLVPSLTSNIACENPGITKPMCMDEMIKYRWYYMSYPICSYIPSSSDIVTVAFCDSTITS